MTGKKQLGDLLVEAGIISTKTLERALERQRGTKKKLGMTLEEMGVITEEEIAEALGKQFGFKTVKGVAEYIYPRELLELVPEDMALSKLAFPLKRNETMLAVAITDPFDTDTLDYISKRSNLRVIPVLTTRKEILEAIKKNYLRDRDEELVLREKILVVEDAAAVASIIQVALSKEHYAVVLAQDGIDGLKAAITERPQLILTDLNMPRMDGYELLRNLRTNQATSGIPVILLTSKATPEEEAKALEAGFFDFVHKPLQPVRIVARVKRAMEINRALQAAALSF